MIKHVVCFKLKQGESVTKAVEVLKSMEGNVPLVREIEVGADFLKSARSYDIILSVVLDGKDELELYQQDKYHVEVVKAHMHAVVQNSIAIDYEI